MDGRGLLAALPIAQLTGMVIVVFCWVFADSEGCLPLIITYAGCQAKTTKPCIGTKGVL